MARKLVIFATLVLSLILGASAAIGRADGPKLDGKWSGSIPRPSHSYDSVFEFKASGDKLTGTVRSSELDQEFEIVDGKIKGDTISFRIGSTSGSYSGKINGDEIAMKVNLSGGEFGSRVMDFTLKRIKE